MTILSKYIFKEQLYPFLTGFIFFTFLLLLNKLFMLADLIINRNVEFIIILKLFFLMLPVTLSLTIPMSVLISVIMALSRLSSDFEIVALRANGASLYKIIKPVIATGIAAFIMMLFFNETIVVHSSRNYNKIFIEILKSSPVSILEEGVFTELGDRTIWIEKIDKENGLLSNVLLYSKKTSGGFDIIKARTGEIESKIDGSKALNLSKGRMYSSDFTRDNFTLVDFSDGNAELTLSEGQISYTGDKDKINTGEMTSLQLFSKLKSADKISKEDRETSLYWVEFFKKHAIPFSCFIFSFIGAPLGIISRKTGRGIGFGISITIFFLYYIIFMTGQHFAIMGSISPFLGVWSANLILLAAGIVIIFWKEKTGR